MSSAGSWRVPAGSPPQIKLVSNAITTGKRHAAEMLGEYLVPPIIDSSIHSRGSVDDIVHPEHVDDYSAVESRRLRGKSSRLCGVSNEDNGVTSIKKIKPSEHVKQPTRDKPRSRMKPSGHVKHPMIKSSEHVKHPMRITDRPLLQILRQITKPSEHVKHPMRITDRPPPRTIGRLPTTTRATIRASRLGLLI